MAETYTPSPAYWDRIRQLNDTVFDIGVLPRPPRLIAKFLWVATSQVDWLAADGGYCGYTATRHRWSAEVADGALALTPLNPKCPQDLLKFNIRQLGSEWLRYYVQPHPPIQQHSVTEEVAYWLQVFRTQRSQQARGATTPTKDHYELVETELARGASGIYPIPGLEPE